LITCSDFFYTVLCASQLELGDVRKSLRIYSIEIYGYFVNLASQKVELPDLTLVIPNMISPEIAYPSSKLSTLIIPIWQYALLW